MIICLQRAHTYAEWKGEKENYTLGYNILNFACKLH